MYASDNERHYLSFTFDINESAFFAFVRIRIITNNGANKLVRTSYPNTVTNIL